MPRPSRDTHCEGQSLECLKQQVCSLGEMCLFKSKAFLVLKELKSARAYKQAPFQLSTITGCESQGLAGVGNN